MNISKSAVSLDLNRNDANIFMAGLVHLGDIKYDVIQVCVVSEIRHVLPLHWSVHP